MLSDFSILQIATATFGEDHMVRQDNMVRKNNIPYLWSSNYIGLWIKSHDWI